MGKKPCCDESEVKKGAWSPEEDQILVNHIKVHGHGTWRSLPKKAGLLRCGKSCRLRWTNYLRPGIKRGPFTLEEENAVIRLHGLLGNRWAAIATQIQGRTDNEIKNYWNTHLKKRFIGSSSNSQPSLMMYHQNNVQINSSTTRHMVQWESVRLEAEVRLSSESLSLLNSFPNPSSDQFLVLWNSEVGMSFRGVIVNDGRSDQTLVSQTSLSDKLGYAKSSDPNDVREIEVRYDVAKTEDMLVDSNSFSHSELSDSGNSVSELLLDFPGGYDSDFFEGKE